MTGHVVSFEPAGAPTRAVCSECGVVLADRNVLFLENSAEIHAMCYFDDSRIEFAGLPPVERAS